MVTIQYLSENLIAVGGGPGSNPESKEPGFVDIYEMLVADDISLLLSILDHF